MTVYPFSAPTGSKFFYLRTYFTVLLGMIVRVRKLRGAGCSLREIADELNRLGIKTHRGSAWRLQYVDGLLKAA